ncbi:MAG TPA: DUF4142 domain-containing protein [Polyangia bacterium]|nr:DUF4142 domain-containing protein [Polyangia bacterium]
MATRGLFSAFVAWFVLSLPGRATLAVDLSSAAILQDLHRSNQEAQELGRLGQRKGNTQEARRFGDIVYYDHRTAERKVSALAKAEKVQLVKVPPAERPLPPGAEFDAAFAEIVIADHQKDLAAVSEAINSTTDKSLQKILGQQLSMLQRHLDIAKKLLSTERKN